MSEKVRSRLRAAERKVAAATGERLGYSLEQLIRAAQGFELGPPRAVLKPGEKALEDLIAECSSRPWATDD